LINEAYSVLGDEKKRRLYDKFGTIGLELDKECKEFANSEQGSIYSKKGFRGTNKSAFEILKDIFEESDEDSNFFNQYRSFATSNSFTAKVRNFIEDNVISTDSDDEEDFCKTYKPTFMNSDFLRSSSILKGKLNPSSTGAQSFSYMSFSSENGNTYTKTMETVVEDGKVQQSLKERVQKGDQVVENEKKSHFDLNDFSNNIPSFLQDNFSLSDNESNMPGISKLSKDIRKEKVSLTHTHNP